MCRGEILLALPEYGTICYREALVRRSPPGRSAIAGGCLSGRLAGNSQKDVQMTWETPVLIELRVGMEVTSYESAEIDLPGEMID